MKWWKRLICSIISLAWGYISLDYLYAAFQKLTNQESTAQIYQPRTDGITQLLGAGMFLLWFLIVALYLYLIRRISNKVDLIETDYKTGKETVKRRQTDLLLQAAFILTGAMLRWCYLVFFYFPSL